MKRKLTNRRQQLKSLGINEDLIGVRPLDQRDKTKRVKKVSEQALIEKQIINPLWHEAVSGWQP